jgi:hypothetical protein
MKNADVLQMMQKVTEVMTGAIISNDHLEALRSWYRLEEAQAAEDGTRVSPAMLICKALIDDLARLRAAQLTEVHVAVSGDTKVSNSATATTTKAAPKPRTRAKVEEEPTTPAIEPTVDAPAASEEPTPAGDPEPEAPAAGETGESEPAAPAQSGVLAGAQGGDW